MGRSLRLLAVGLAGATWGCFSAPSADVLFSCDPESAPQCPPEYTCQSDGCCHRDGSDVDASRGACNSSATSGLISPDTDPTSGTGSPETDGTSTASDTDTDTDASGSLTGETGGSSSSSTTG